MEVESLERIRANLETSANQKRRDADMREIGELLLRLNHVEGLMASAKNLAAQEQDKVKKQSQRLRKVEQQFRGAPEDVNVVAMKRQKIIQSRYLTIQRKHDRLRKQAQEAQRSVEQGMMLRQSFREAYTRIERQYERNANLLKKMLTEISALNEKRNEFLKKATHNRGASNENKEEIMNKLRSAEQMANVEYDTRNLSVCRAVDRTPYWKNESITRAMKSFWEKPVAPPTTMQDTVELEATMAAIRRIMNVDNMSDVIKLHRKREENNELLAERLRDLVKEAEDLVDRIEGHYKYLHETEHSTAQWEDNMEKKIMMLLERTRNMEENGRGCRESLLAFRAFYDKIGPKVTEVFDLMYRLIPHSEELKKPEAPCTGQNYREYQMAFSRLAFYFHAVFDYWKQHEHERKSRTDPLYRGTDDDDHPLALQEEKLSHVNYPVAAKLKLLPKELRYYRKRNQFENEDGTPAVMSAKSMEHFAETEAAELLHSQNEYLRNIDGSDIDVDEFSRRHLADQERMQRGLVFSPPDPAAVERQDEIEKEQRKTRQSPPLIGVKREPLITVRPEEAPAETPPKVDVHTAPAVMDALEGVPFVAPDSDQPPTEATVAPPQGNELNATTRAAEMTPPLPAQSAPEQPIATEPEAPPTASTTLDQPLLPPAVETTQEAVPPGSAEPAPTHVETDTAALPAEPPSTPSVIAEAQPSPVEGQADPNSSQPPPSE
ncbi:uncharacterized protein LOC129590325 isoform X2 [Paramacrobiotus metropolitanus]|nr:uncharacterized protein LOC129590325 isoform X2 [Paramacrobiotus metropolitanus]